MKKGLALLVGLCFVSLYVEAAELRQVAAGQIGIRIDGSKALDVVRSYSGGSIGGEAILMWVEWRQQG